jgi:hypothetical protein
MAEDATRKGPTGSPILWNFCGSLAPGMPGMLVNGEM